MSLQSLTVVFFLVYWDTSCRLCISLIVGFLVQLPQNPFGWTLWTTFVLLRSLTKKADWSCWQKMWPRFSRVWLVFDVTSQTGLCFGEVHPLVFVQWLTNIVDTSATVQHKLPLAATCVISSKCVFVDSHLCCFSRCLDKCRRSMRHSVIFLQIFLVRKCLCVLILTVLSVTESIREDFSLAIGLFPCFH